MTGRTPRVLIVAGEASGDLHAARLVNGVRRHHPEVRFYGIGGSEMRKAGVDILVDSAELAVVGLIEVLAQRKVIFGTLNRMRELLRSDPPDLLILTDYPDFNLRLAETAKNAGVKVLYYISPQVWAWRQRR
ncbi:MAG TPA: lipid-A-disaccharide synthase, partial [Chromatiales bacterium]|nr:lipid-A-disaccharide synthase [Chromatiales bacterium]